MLMRWQDQDIVAENELAVRHDPALRCGIQLSGINEALIVRWSGDAEE